jgi:ABC-type transporter Mla subunit MlaD
MSDSLQTIVIKIGEAVVATTDTVEKIADHVNAIAAQLQQQEGQLQQQGYQIFALTEALQALIDSQVSSQQQMNELQQTLKTLLDRLPPTV